LDIGTGNQDGKTEKAQVDHVVYATGVTLDFGAIPAIQPLIKAHPIHIVGGIPCSTSELMWMKRSHSSSLADWED
jgi:hypothetical protein